MYPMYPNKSKSSHFYFFDLYQFVKCIIDVIDIFYVIKSVKLSKKLDTWLQMLKSNAVLGFSVSMVGYNWIQDIYAKWI